MYFFDFFKNLFKKSNVGIIIYLILNVILLLMFFGNQSAGGFFKVIIIYAISLIIALSPVGELILRLQTGSKNITRRDIREKIVPLFKNVYEKAKQKDLNLPKDISIFIHYDPTPNAFAVGRKTICVTQGLLTLPEEEIEAILAHEFAHLSHKDTDLLLVIMVGNLIVTTIFIVTQLIIAIVAAIAGKHGWIVALVSVIVGAFMWIWTKIGMLLVLHAGRQNEFNADKFASDIGYGTELASALDKITGQQPEFGLWKAIQSTHPNTHDRIGKLQDLGAEYSSY